MPLLHDNLLDFLQRQQGIDVTDLDADTPLFSSGLLDSFSMPELVLLVESQCGFKVPPVDVNLDNLDSIRRILAYTGSRTGGKDTPREPTA